MVAPMLQTGIVDHLLNLLSLFFGFPHSPNNENRPPLRGPTGVVLLTCEFIGDIFVEVLLEVNDQKKQTE